MEIYDFDNGVLCWRDLMRSKFKYLREFNTWKRDFAVAAVEDNYAELQRLVKHLGVECSPEHMIACSALLVRAVMGYRQMDGQDSGSFLQRQHYRPGGEDGNFYCLILEIGKSSFGRILADVELADVDFEDLFNHSWPGLGTAGFTKGYVTRLDGKRIGKRELKQLNERVTSDLYYGYSEEEVSVDVISSGIADTAEIYAVETDEYDFEAFDFHVVRAAGFITRFGSLRVLNVR